MKKILQVLSNQKQHWVGDGFPVRTLFSHQAQGHSISPFLLLDYAGPAHFSPATAPRGVGKHPHRGFETVTIVYQGEIEHHDSTGAGGRIGAGDVQWMTAGSGLLHEEFHSERFTHSGGTLENVQLWVNLPARDKMSAPGYQAITDADIPSVALPDGAGRVRIIAGEFKGCKGPAHTFTPIDVWDMRLKAGGAGKFSVAEGRMVALAILHGTVIINGETTVGNGAHIVLFDTAGTEISLHAKSDSTVLLMSGEPINEEIVAYGPFVMNTHLEIEQAIEDFNNGRFGRN